MNSQEFMLDNSNSLANNLMRQMEQVEEQELMLDLTSADLFRIDSAILSSLKNSTDFSRDMLKQLEAGTFEEFPIQFVKSFDSEVLEIQQEALTDITLPLQNLFDELSVYVTEAIRS